jgi:hypothetical protein
VQDDGAALAGPPTFGGFGLGRGASGSRGELKLRATAACRVVGEGRLSLVHAFFHTKLDWH